MIQQHFEFTPSFAKIEEFLKLYQKFHESREQSTLICLVSDDYWTSAISYPDIEKNCWLTLRFAVDEMNRFFLEQKSKTQVIVQKRVGNS